MLLFFSKDHPSFLRLSSSSTLSSSACSASSAPSVTGLVHQNVQGVCIHSRLSVCIAMCTVMTGNRAEQHWPGHEHPHEHVDVVDGGLLDVVGRTCAVLRHHSRMNGTSQAKPRLGRMTAGSVHMYNVHNISRFAHRKPGCSVGSW